MQNYDTFWNDLISGKFASLVASVSKRKEVNSPEEVYNITKPLFAAQPDVEQMYALLLDPANRIMTIEKISSGTIDKCHVFVREIIKSCIKNKAKYVILVHNHPSGNAAISDADILFTKKTFLALSFADIGLLDHLVVGDGFSSVTRECNTKNWMEIHDKILAGWV